ncbi:MAG: hypothetical protein EOO77_26930 [Oxalobacteraceae bacterium]|nr:MAG: hypothetical protein EOO77_26930 [Oxalobacteraceae bacterium]
MNITYFWLRSGGSPLVPIARGSREIPCANSAISAISPLRRPATPTERRTPPCYSRHRPCARDQPAATRAAERTRDLALIRYRDGASDYLDVVTAQTAALDAQRRLLEVQSTRLQIEVDTVRAIGGGTAT